MSNVSSKGTAAHAARDARRGGRRVLVWLYACSALAGLSCKAKLPDGVFVCATDPECPTGFACQDNLCRRGAKTELTTHADAALPNETTGMLPDAASEGGSRASGVAGSSGESGGVADAGANRVVVPPPPPPPFMPHTFVPLPSGRSITAAGTYMQSGSYRLWTALGQAPGTGYPMRSSSNYRLVGGIVGVLQSEQ